MCLVYSRHVRVIVTVDMHFLALSTFCMPSYLRPNGSHSLYTIQSNPLNGDPDDGSGFGQSHSHLIVVVKYMPVNGSIRIQISLNKTAEPSTGFDCTSFHVFRGRNMLQHPVSNADRKSTQPGIGDGAANRAG